MSCLGLGFFRLAFARDAGNGAVVVSHLEECGLFSGVPLQFVHVQFAGNAGRARWFVFSLNPALGFIALFLLARVFFLAFGKA